MRTKQAELDPCERPDARDAVSFDGSASEWSSPPVSLQLADDEAHVWLASLDAFTPDLPRLAEALSTDEHRRAERFQFEQDRSRFIVRRGLLRMLLARYLNLDPAQLAFAYQARGKPVLSGLSESTTLQFNLSHSAGLALFAVARRVPVGVDIEKVRALPDADQVAAKFFSGREYAMLGAVPAEQRLEAFFNCWTRKEACLKATGEGIAEALPQMEVSLASGQPAQLLSVNGDSRAVTRWLLHSLAPSPGFAGAFACHCQNLGGIKETHRDQRHDPYAGIGLVKRFAFARIQTAP